jgi:hypothetical protein
MRLFNIMARIGALSLRATSALFRKCRKPLDALLLALRESRRRRAAREIRQLRRLLADGQSSSSDRGAGGAARIAAARPADHRGLNRSTHGCAEAGAIQSRTLASDRFARGGDAARPLLA